MKRPTLLLLTLASLLTVAAEGAPPIDEAGAPFPRFAPREPAAVAETFVGRDGFRMELLAAEPMVFDPVAAAYDEDGRLFVVEMSDYPHVDPANDRPYTDNVGDPPIGRVRVLTDRDGDGRFDASHILADKLSWPTGVAVWKGGVFVAATPDIWYLKDTDGDHSADVRERVFTGFRKFNVQAVMNNLQWGLDHRIYGAAAANGGQVRPGDDPDAEPIKLQRADFRFEPGMRRFEAISGGARFGNTFDDWGNRFICMIRNPAQHVVLPRRYLARNPDLAAPSPVHDAAEFGDMIRMFRISPPEPWRELRARRWAAVGMVKPRSELVGAGVLTSSSGVTFYRGDAYPEAYRGNLFVGEVANNLIHRMTVRPDGVTFRASRADEGVEFVASTDTWFRPVNFVNAPDGTLHVVDMYRETIEHPWSIPDDIRARLHLRSGEDRGRIYRLEPPGFRARPTPTLSRAATAELVVLLEHPNGWHRETAHRLIFERQDRSAVAALRSLLRDSEHPLGRLHALWSIEGLDALQTDDLLIGLGDESGGVREHAVLLAEPLLRDSSALLDKVLALTTDPAARVRFQVALTLGEVEGPRAVTGLAAIARRDATDPWIRTAVLSSATGPAVPLFETLMDEPGVAASPEGMALPVELARVIGARGRPDEVRRVFSALARGTLKYRDAVLDVLLGLADGLGRAGRRLADLRAGLPDDAAKLVDDLFAHAARIAPDLGAPPDRRERAITLLGHGPYDQAIATLPDLLEPRQPQRVQQAAVKALARFSEPAVASVLLRPWRAYTPTVRSEAIQALLGRRAWNVALLDAVEDGTIALGQLTVSRRSFLLKSPDPVVRAKAQALFANDTLGPRSEVFARYRPALDSPAGPSRGRAAFERECMTCHRLGDQGHPVGPNLASVRHRTPEEILIHILDPNREVAPDFLEYTIAMDDGRVLSGLIESETPGSLILRRAEGTEETVLRRNIEAISSTGRSLMPEGLEARIAPQEMADLIAFLLEVQRQ